MKNENGVKRRNEIADIYKRAFEGRIKFQSLPNNTYNAHHLFIIEIDGRKDLYDYLKGQNILAQIHYIPVHTLPYYKNIGYKDANLINTENYYSKCISLPMYPTLTDVEQTYVINKINTFYSEEY